MITIHPNNQYIPKGFGFFQIADMAEVEEVKTAIGKDDPLAFGFEVLDDISNFFSCLDLLFHSIPFII
jgi:hypothetical protein